MTFTRMVALVACVAMAAPLALAQPEPRPHRSDSRGTRGDGRMHKMGPGPMHDLESQGARELVEMVMLARMSRELELDDEQTVLLIRRFEEAKERTTELSKERSEAMKELKRSIRDKEAEGVIEQKLERLIGLDTELAQVKLEAFTEVRDGFTVTQRAKLYVFVQEFSDKMRDLVHRARQQRGRMGSPPDMQDMRQEFRDGMRQRQSGFGGQGGGRRNQSGTDGAIEFPGPPGAPIPGPPANNE